MNAPAEGFSVTLTLRDGYAFDVDTGQPGATTFVLDEPPPLGEGRGPNATRVLAAAVGHCLSASLLFCLRKARVEVRSMRTTVTGSLVRNERGRLRIGGIQVTLAPDVPTAQHERMGRCLDLFEDFCIVTASVRQAFPVDVTVETGAVAAAV